MYVVIQANCEGILLSPSHFRCCSAITYSRASASSQRASSLTTSWKTPRSDHTAPYFATELPFHPQSTLQPDYLFVLPQKYNNMSIQNHFTFFLINSACSNFCRFLTSHLMKRTWADLGDLIEGGRPVSLMRKCLLSLPLCLCCTHTLRHTYTTPHFPNMVWGQCLKLHSISYVSKSLVKLSFLSY